ncbi:aspartyl/asparaginyl beta-hydroxylase domain-containing protein [Novosphingobium sp.]|uniref:aspartyl/asparaginyl beta-hydroxylase domain-containing protein n=1 Tax=Novosphingobium sp. TaxID=1874826 RepID=UPI0026127889|nr:aspartyl/asparaginyl beta-hydroxylase domain-containing protein [Novosphingobium sp.]
MTTISPDVLITEGLAALRARDAARAAALLRDASACASPERMPWPALAQAELALGQHAAAEAALDRQLALTPRDVGALLAKGQLRQRAGDDRAAVSFYTTALAQAAVSGIPRGMEGMAAAAQAFMGEAQGSFQRHLDAVMTGGLSPAMEEALGLLRGTREIDLQQPSLFYYPGLPQRRFYDPAEFSWMEGVLDLLPAMQAELAAVMAEEAEDTFAPYVTASEDRPAPNNPLLGDPAWGAFYFWKDGAAVAANAARCPATMAALALAPMPIIPGRAPNALWSRLKPGTHIAPHTGMLNTRLICHVPIRTAFGCTLRVGSETRTWEPGVPLIFDDSMEHEARNAGPETRTVLLFEIWRPEVPEEDRAAIARLLEGIAGYDGTAA